MYLWTCWQGYRAAGIKPHGVSPTGGALHAALCQHVQVVDNTVLDGGLWGADSKAFTALWHWVWLQIDAARCAALHAHVKCFGFRTL